MNNIDSNIERMSKWLIGGVYQNRHNGKQIRITESYLTDSGYMMFRADILPLKEHFQPTTVLSDLDLSHWDYIGETEAFSNPPQIVGAMYDSLIAHCAEKGYDISEWQEVWEHALTESTNVFFEKSGEEE